jgi:hypothetical protein
MRRKKDVQQGTLALMVPKTLVRDPYARECRPALGCLSGGRRVLSRAAGRRDRRGIRPHPPVSIETSQPNVNANASTPASRNSIAIVRSTIGVGCRTSWYSRCSLNIPLPPSSTSRPRAAPGG